MTNRLGLDVRKIRIVFLRELRDQLRDRRTLFLVIALPVILYPALGIGMLQMAVVFSETPRTVVVLGAESLPEPHLIEGPVFAARWCADPSDALRLSVETAARIPEDPDIGPRIEAARKVHDQFRQRRELINSAAASQSTIPESLAAEIETVNASINTALQDAGIDVLVVIPDGFAASLEAVNRMIAARAPSAEAPSEYPRPVILVNGDEQSLIASRRVERVFDAWEDELLRLRLEAAGLPSSLPSPVNATVVKVAGSQHESAIVWSKLYPAILVVMTVTGAFYPAVDLAAGEKERGTMETLLISPARRIELVLAKFLTILVFSLATAALNIISLGISVTYMLQLAGNVSPHSGLTMGAPPLAGFLWIGVMVIPLAALFSSLSLALATFARSTREGQYYLSPLMIVVMLMVGMTAAPGIELEPFHSVLPVIGPILLLKSLMIAPGATESLSYLPVVLASSFVYAAMGLWWAVAQFHSETVLFREAERFDLRLWFRRLRTHKPLRPGAGAALTCLAIGMLGQVMLMQPLASWLGSVAELDRPRAAIWALIAQQGLLFLLPALLLGILLVSDWRGTFRLHKPPRFTIAVSITLALALHPLVLELMQHLAWFFPPGLPDGSQEFLKAMLGPGQPVWLILLAVSVTPALCEEWLFRGYVLSAFDRPGRRRLAIVVQAIAFGAMHMIPHQVFSATLLGLVLGLLALRTGSLWPGIAFHLTFNALAIARERVSPPTQLSGVTDWLFSFDTDSGLRYDWPLLCFLAAVATGLFAVIRRWTPDEHPS